MSDPSHKPRRSWWPVIGAGVALGVFLAILGARYFVRPPQRTWTDGASLAVPDRRAPLRRVLWTEPRTLGRLFNTTTHEYEPALSPDGTAIYFVRGAETENPDLYVSFRRDDAWSVPTPLTELNSEHAELGPQLSPDGNWLAFSSDRPGGAGGYDVHFARRTRGGWSAPRNAGDAVNSPFHEVAPVFSHDGRRLYFSSDRPVRTDRQRAGQYDLFVADVADPRGKDQPPAFAPARPLAAVNSPAAESAPRPSPDGRFLYFASDREGGYGGFDLYRARLGVGGIEEIENLGPQVNSPADDTAAHLSLDGFQMHLCSNRSGTIGGYDLYRAVTREVHAALSPAPAPTIGWSWWALGIALVLMLLLAVYLRESTFRDLTLLHKCVLVSLIAHVLLTALLSILVVSQDIIEAVADDPGMATTVNLDVSREVEVALQVRKQLTDLPVVDPTLTQLARAESTPVSRTSIEKTDVQVPLAERPAESRAAEPTTPQVQPPQPVERVTLSLPRVASEQPVFHVQQPAPIQQDEARPATEQVTPVPQVQPRAEQRVAAAPVDTHAPAPPAQPRNEQLIELAEADRPPLPDAEPLDPATPGPVQVFADLQPTVEDSPRQPVASHRPEAPEVDDAIVDTARYETASPRQQPHAALMPVPTARATERSILVAVTPAPERAVAVQPLTLDVPGALTGPTVRLPSTHDAQTSDERPLMARDDVESIELAARPADRRQAQPDVDRFDPTGGAAPDAQTPASLARQPQARMDAPHELSGTLTPALAEPVPLAVTADLGPRALDVPDWLFHRTGEQRLKLLDEFGGTGESEAAVERALRFLARLQEDGGHWTQTKNETGPTGRTNHPVDVAVTGLSAMCFLAADHRPHREGPYRQTVEKALDYLVDRQKSNGDLRGAGDMYSQAIGTLALAEAAAMTGDERYGQAAARGAAFIIDAQHHQTGGWRYKPGDPGDTSVFGWQILALHSAEQLGFEIPDNAQRLAFDWLDRVRKDRHSLLSKYQTNRGPSRAMTAEAVFSRMLLGEEPDRAQRREVAGYLLAEPPGKGKDNFYYWYYASLAMMQLGGDGWAQWNDLARSHLVTTQRDKGGLAGSWDSNSQWGPRGGRIYTTALATLTLQVYYRYLPMYRQVE